MTARPMHDADAIYVVASNSIVGWNTIEHPTFAEFCVGVSAFEKQLGGEHDEPFWVELRRLLRRTRSTISATPLPFNSAALGILHAQRELERRIAHLSRQNPIDLGQPLHALCDLLALMARMPDDPMGDRAVELAERRSSGTCALLLPTRRHQDAVTKSIGSKFAGNRLRVVNPGELAIGSPVDSLFVCGSTSWYRKDRHVFTSPRATRVQLLRWSWVRDSLPDRALFLGGRTSVRIQSDHGAAPAAARQQLVDAAEIAPHIDWEAIVQRVGHHDEAQAGDLVASRVLLLAAGWAVALSNSSIGTVHVVEPDLSASKRVRELDVDSIAIGDFVLLRSEGAGHLVVEIADAELGNSAIELRNAQRKWKSALRDRVAHTTLSAAVRQLQLLGSPRANATNLRNWMAPRSLRTGNFDDFSAVMRYVNLAGEATMIWQSMEILEHAHRRAGHRIRKMLIDVVANADLEALEAEGVMDFALEAGSGGTLTAYRVEAIAPVIVEVNEHRLGRPVDAEDLWLG